LWSAPVPPAAKHPHNMILPPPCFMAGMVFFGLQAPPFFLQTQQWSLWSNSSIFVSSDQRTFLQKVWSLSPCAVAKLSLAFYGGFGAVASSLLSGHSGYVDIGLWLYLTVDIDTFVPVSSSIFTGSFAAVLGLNCTSHIKVHSSLGDRTGLLPEQYDCCVVPWCLYLRTIVCTDEHGTFRHLEMSPKDEPDLWRSTHFFWGLGWFLLIFPWCQAKMHWVWR
jgi:hypothetical protein